MVPCLCSQQSKLWQSTAKAAYAGTIALQSALKLCTPGCDAAIRPGLAAARTT